MEGFSAAMVKVFWSLVEDGLRKKSDGQQGLDFEEGRL
jgi:hypothetical protein